MRDMNEFNNLETTKTQFPLMHLNISSLQYHFEELGDLLNTPKTKFDVVGITKVALRKVLLHCKTSIFKIIKLNILQQNLKKVALYYTSPQI